MFLIINKKYRILNNNIIIKNEIQNTFLFFPIIKELKNVV